MKNAKEQENEEMSTKMGEGRRKGMSMCRDMRARARTVTVSLTVVAIALALSVFAYTALAAQVSVEPACQIVLKGENFTVNISVDPEENEYVFVAQYSLYFNNTLLNGTSPVNGSFLSQDGADTLVLINTTNNTIGKTEYGEMRIDVNYGINTSGTLSTITFQAIADGCSELVLDDVILADSNQSIIPANITNGSVRIGLCGDVNGNGEVTGYDKTVLALYIGEVPGWELNCRGC